VPVLNSSFTFFFFRDISVDKNDDKYASLTFTYVTISSIKHH